MALTNQQLKEHIDSRFDDLGKKIDAINGRVRQNEQNIGRIDERTKSLERDMTAQKWTERAISMISAAIAAAVGVFVKSP